MTKELLDYPPSVQIEITSVCNYRCIFCYQTDNHFNKKSNKFMGHMELNVFKRIIDELESQVEFITLASRGEPLLSKSFVEMINYTKNKFLGLKINTNASLLNDQKSYAILDSNVSTLVISADAADEKNYPKYRVNGNFKNIIKNIENFNKIKKNTIQTQKL